MTKKEASRPQEIRTQLDALEKTQGICDWKEFLLYSDKMQGDAKQAWLTYFEAISGTIPYLLFQEQREAFRLGNISKVKELAQEMRDMEKAGDYEPLPQPRFFDEDVFSNSQLVRTYKSLVYELDRIRQEESYAQDSDL